MPIKTYLNNLQTRYQTGIAREHSYRGDLQNLLSTLLPDVLVTNEPARIACGAPDYILTRKEIPIGYIEAKDIGVDLNHKSLAEQLNRYRSSLNNLIITDYLSFYFYKAGNLVTSVCIADIVKGKVTPKPENFNTFTQLIKNFADEITQSIQSATQLAEMMAQRAKLMAEVIEKSLNEDDLHNTISALKAQMLTFKDLLIHDITNSAFADVYAQTIAYGMFAARYHDPTLPTFSRQEAATLIPQSNPFLRKLFQSIAGYDLDERLVWIVDELVQIFLATNVADIMRNFGVNTQQEDPVIHFYETFLAAYNPALRKARGVWYTPQAVVSFIVRAVDDVLKTHFNLPQGIADTSTIPLAPFGKGGKRAGVSFGNVDSFLSSYEDSVSSEEDKKLANKNAKSSKEDKKSFSEDTKSYKEGKKSSSEDKKSSSEDNTNSLKEGTSFKETVPVFRANEKQRTPPFPKGAGGLHRVQVLDPATGTGTFLAEVINHIYQKFKNQQGIWSNYVENHLIPRLNGFELLMASYAMAHLKLDMLLTQTGYKPTRNQRLRVFLTNSLEEHHPDAGTLFSSWLSDEANEANQIKRDTPVMVVLGNPPYAVESANKNDWIDKLMDDYKKEPGGKEKLKERNPKSINDDYVKFLRYAQHFIERNGAGIVAFINPHGYLDNATFRGMRWNLLKTYDTIYTIDLHGNSKKKETAPDGSPDQNVFDIQQGVSINIFIKTNKKKPTDLATVYHYDLYGKRPDKYQFLLNNTLHTIPFVALKPSAPNYFFVQKNFDEQTEYDKGFSVAALFKVNSVGIVTARDAFSIQHSPQAVEETINTFLSLDDEAARAKFNLGADVRDWTVAFAQKDLITSGVDFNRIVPIAYRPFDNRYTYYTGKSKGFHCMPRGEVMKHFINGENVGLILNKAHRCENYRHSFIVNSIGDYHITETANANAYVFPLYLYLGNEATLDDNAVSVVPNLDMGIIKEFEACLGMTFKSPLAPFGKGGVGEELIFVREIDDNEPVKSPLPPFGKGGVDEELISLREIDDTVEFLQSKNKNNPLSQRGQVDCDELLQSKDNNNSNNVESLQSKDNNTPLSQRGQGDYKLRKYNDDLFYIPYKPYLKELARELRKNMTVAEKKVWYQLLSRDGLEGWRFLRQKPLLNFIADFYCSKLLLVVEIDGGVHTTEEAKAYDDWRTELLATYGIKVVRYWNDDVYKRFDWVKEDLLREINERIALFSDNDQETITENVTTVETTTENLPDMPLPNTFTPVDVLDYIYAVLHSPTYRSTYAEFLKIDFPRVPYARNIEQFWHLVGLGNQLRHYHLLTHPNCSNYQTQYPIDGNNVVDKPRAVVSATKGVEFVDVYINNTQYFADVPQVAFDFYIGGYQPAQKWLKDRKGSALGFDDILHYQQIIVSLTQTAALMLLVDEVMMG